MSRIKIAQVESAFTNERLQQSKRTTTLLLVSKAVYVFIMEPLFNYWKIKKPYVFIESVKYFV